MRVLVTGGAGYIGSVLVPRFLDEGYEVTVVDDFRYGQTSLLECCHDTRLTVIRGDARDTGLIRDCLRTADVVFPLACLTGAPLCERDPVGARSINLEAVTTILEARSPDQWVIFPTTNSGYGIGEPDVLCTEASPLRPVSLYGRLKVEAEMRVLEQPNTMTLRLATAFGVSPRMRLDLLVNDFTYRAVTDGFIVLFEAGFKRNYIHVRDIARAFLHGLVNFERLRGEPYNVGLSDANLSKAELCDEIRKQVPRFYWVEAPVGRDPDQRNYVVSNARIEQTGFKPAVSLPAGIAELIRGYTIVRRGGYANV